jgi:hypothetical protein
MASDHGDLRADPSRFRRSAEQLIRRGFKVFPCYGIVALPDGTRDCSCPPTHSSRQHADGRCMSPGKHPVTARGYLDASGDPAVIHRWWPEPQHGEPESIYNPAIACGLSHLLVIDVDHHGGVDGMAVWMEICATIDINAQPDNAPIVLTGEVPGQHLYLAVPPAYCDRLDTLQFRKTLAPNVDIKCVGGYVMAPNAEHISGRAYDFAIGHSMSEIEEAFGLTWPPDAPDALMALCIKQGPTYIRGGTPGAIADSLLAELFERRGLVLATFPDKWCVTCLWQDEHTTGNSLTGTVLFPPLAPGGLGGLCCQHAHCADRGAADALKIFSPEEIATARAALTARGVPDPGPASRRPSAPPPGDLDAPACEAAVAGPDLATSTDTPDRPDVPPPASPADYGGNGSMPPPDFSPYRNGDGTPLPWLNVGNGDLEGQTTALSEELGRLRDPTGHPTVYQRGTDLVRVRADPGTAAHI